jgi:hypothetical protein
VFLISEFSHPECVNNLISFLSKIITFHDIKKVEEMDADKISKYYEKIDSYIKKFGDTLINKTISYFLTVPPEIVVEGLKNLVLDLVMNYPEDTAAWFEKNLREIPSDCLTDTEKEKFVKTVGKKNEHEMEDVLDNFYRRCLSRLYRQK